MHPKEWCHRYQICPTPSRNTWHDVCSFGTIFLPTYLQIVSVKRGSAFKIILYHCKSEVSLWPTLAMTSMELCSVLKLVHYAVVWLKSSCMQMILNGLKCYLPLNYSLLVETVFMQCHFMALRAVPLIVDGLRSIHSQGYSILRLWNVWRLHPNDYHRLPSFFMIWKTWHLSFAFLVHVTTLYVLCVGWWPVGLICRLVVFSC